MLISDFVTYHKLKELEENKESKFELKLQKLKIAW